MLRGIVDRSRQAFLGVTSRAAAADAAGFGLLVVYAACELLLEKKIALKDSLQR